MRKQILKLLLAIGIIAFAVTITAVSCGKTGGGDDKPLVPTTNLVLSIPAGPTNYAKLSGNTITISAAVLATALTPHSDTEDTNRGFDDTSTGGGRTVRANIFDIQYPHSTGGTSIILLNRPLVSTNNITMPAFATACPSSESDDEALATAASGSSCREYTETGRGITFYSYLGTVFNNTDTANRARGIMRCRIRLGSWNAAAGIDRLIDDTVLFNSIEPMYCDLAMINSGGGAAAAEIDDAWVGDSASVKEVELHAIGIDVTGKTIEQFSGLKKAEFDKALDNAAFKRLLRNNEWGELKFKVRIVTAAAF